MQPLKCRECAALRADLEDDITWVNEEPERRLCPNCLTLPAPPPE